MYGLVTKANLRKLLFILFAFTASLLVVNVFFTDYARAEHEDLWLCNDGSFDNPEVQAGLGGRCADSGGRASTEATSQCHSRGTEASRRNCIENLASSSEPNIRICNDGTLVNTNLPGSEGSCSTNEGFAPDVYVGVCGDEPTQTDRQECIADNPNLGGGNNGPAPCTPEGGGSFLGISPWYKYLDEGRQGADGECNLHISSLNDIWKIVLAVLDALLRVAAYVAVGFMIFAGFIYMTSNGNPEKTKQALGTIRLSAIGLIITVASTLIVSFIAGRF